MSAAGARWRRTALLACIGAAVAGSAQAYIGPGAGFALTGSFAALLAALGAGALALLAWPLRLARRALRRRKALGRARVRRLVVLGLDGLDPSLAERWMAEGRLPELARLAREGSFQRLRTTYPSISPVAWSSFMTGVEPARHNIFDFLTRDPRTYAPALSSADVSSSPRAVRIGSWVLPLGRPRVRGLRKSRAFWSILAEHGVPCHVLRVPLTFPPERFAGMLLSAMCVPDLRGTQGSYTFYTTDPALAAAGADSPELASGERYRVELAGDAIEATLPGPALPGDPPQSRAELPFRVVIDREQRCCRLALGRRHYTLKEREYSPWIPLEYRTGAGTRARGIARFYVTALEPHFGLYVTPLHIDPARPALPISFPGYFSVYLAKLLGRFATLGLAEDTSALNEGVIDEEAFLKQTLDHHAEREAMFLNALSKSRDGLVACVFDGTDRLQHMFFRYLEDDHPANAGKDVVRYRHAIRDMYERVDALVGRTRRALGPRDALLVLSDHGFQSFRRGVNLNSWLRERGYLCLKPGHVESGEWFEHVDWSRTRAYAFGLGGLYLNRRGREAQGIVEPGAEAEELKRALAEQLSGLCDPGAGQVAVNEAFDPLQVHGSGPYAPEGPDLIIGYARGYRASWEGAVGRTTPDVFCDNTRAWSGDHCVDPRLVPGVLFSDLRIRAEDPGITDMAPTVLALFGVEVPAHMTGRPLDVGSSGAGAEAGHAAA